MTAKEFYEQEMPDNNDDYDLSAVDYWDFGKDEMILFAERYKQEIVKRNSEIDREKIAEAAYQASVNCKNMYFGGGFEEGVKWILKQLKT